MQVANRIAQNSQMMMYNRQWNRNGLTSIIGLHYDVNSSTSSDAPAPVPNAMPYVFGHVDLSSPYYTDF